MMNNLLTSKIAIPYARALYNLTDEINTVHKLTADFQNLKTFLDKNVDLTNYLNNPSVSKKEKQEILVKIIKKKINIETFMFLNFLLRKNRINLLKSIITNYLNLVYETATVKKIKVTTALPFTNRQINRLIKKLKKLTNSREIRLTVTVDYSLIGGFLIQTSSKVLDFTIKNELQKLAKHLDNVSER